MQMFKLASLCFYRLGRGGEAQGRGSPRSSRQEPPGRDEAQAGSLFPRERSCAPLCCGQRNEIDGCLSMRLKRVVLNEC